MKGHSPQNIWILLLLLLAGVANLFGGFSGLGWLAYGSSFGLTSPLVLDLGVLTLQFGFTIRFTIAGLIGIVLAFFLYRRL